jgi:single-stranded-DNA-specific exonuclease
LDKRWNILPYHTEKVKSLQLALGIQSEICILLNQRGIYDFEVSKNFFRPQLAHLHDPFLMKDMHKAVAEIIEYKNKNKKILVFGDYDVDGTTSVALMYQFLVSIYNEQQVDFYIPHRYKEGYGVSKAGIDYAKEHNFELIVTLDCGIKSMELVAYAKSMGIEFIICDHHMPDDEVPDALAILNPKQVDCAYPFKELCGCGVGFKLICALTQKLDLPIDMAYEYLDLVATAIAADIVPIVDENRVLAYYGLQKANTKPNNGIAALKQLSNLKENFTISNLVFIIAPRVNAAGRMDDAEKAVLMFVQKSVADAMQYAELLHSDNTDRREADSTTTIEALSMIENDAIFLTKKSTVLFQPHWHKGVVGIVASRLIEKHYKPTIVLTQSGDYVAGSARSVSGFNLYEAIHACKEYLLGYGGHFFAAGLTMLPEHVPAFANKFETVVQNSISEAQMQPEIVIDCEIELQNCTQKFLNIIKQMEPFGPENLRPVFLARKVYNTGYSKIVKDNHIKFSFKQNSTIMNGIGFALAEKFHLLEMDEPLDIVFTLEENNWNNMISIQLKVIDFRLTWDNKDLNK